MVLSEEQRAQLRETGIMIFTEEQKEAIARAVAGAPAAQGEKN